MFLELIFATVLDMSLPEFQPEIDISGNVIVSEDIDGEFIASEIPFDEINILDVSVDDVSEGLSPDTSNNDEIIDYSLSSLRSFETHTVNASVKSNFRVNSGKLGVHSGDDLYYVYLTAGIEYQLSSTSGIYWCLSLNKDETVHSYSSSTITPEQNLYLVKNNSSFYVTYTTGTPDDEPDVSGDDVSGDDAPDVSGGDVSGGDVSGGDGQNNIDLSSVNNKLDTVILLLRSIRLILLFNFLYPLAMSCVKMIGGKKDV